MDREPREADRDQAADAQLGDQLRLGGGRVHAVERPAQALGFLVGIVAQRGDVERLGPRPEGAAAQQERQEKLSQKGSPRPMQTGGIVGLTAAAVKFPIPALHPETIP